VTVWDLRAVFSKLEQRASPDIAEGGMAAEASTRRLRPGSPASARVAAVAAGLAVAAFGVCGVLLLLTRDYQRAAW